MTSHSHPHPHLPAVTPAGTSAVAEHSPSGLAVRPLETADDYRACVDLQRQIWGDTFEAVPAAILQISTHVGGIAVGAFDSAKRLAGFVFGLTGVEHDKVIHWSHILGVRPELRNAGVGRVLKDYQRRDLARRHISEMYWTYDPSIAKNAHFNLNVLGARVVRFAPDMYGNTGSPLHHGLATDRLVVVCDTTRAPRDATPYLSEVDTHTPVLTPHPRASDPMLMLGATSAPRIRLEAHPDFSRLLADSPVEAHTWHTAIREHFQWALANGYAVTGFARDPESSRSFYLLEMLAPADQAAHQDPAL